MEIDLDQIIEELAKPAAQDSKSWVSRTKIHEKINSLKPKINTATSPTAMELVGILELVQKGLKQVKILRDIAKQFGDNIAILEEYKKSENTMDDCLPQAFQIVEDTKDELTLENVITVVDLYGAIVEEQRIIGKYKKLDSVASFRDVDRRVAESVNEIIELDKKNQQKLKQILPNVGKGVANGFRKK